MLLFSKHQNDQYFTQINRILFQPNAVYFSNSDYIVAYVVWWIW